MFRIISLTPFFCAFLATLAYHVKGKCVYLQINYGVYENKSIAMCIDDSDIILK